MEKPWTEAEAWSSMRAGVYEFSYRNMVIDGCGFQPELDKIVHDPSSPEEAPNPHTAHFFEVFE